MGGNFYKKRVVCQTICGCPSTEGKGFYFFAMNICIPCHTCGLKMCFFGNKTCSPVLSWGLQLFHVFSLLLTFLRDFSFVRTKICQKIAANF